MSGIQELRDRLSIAADDPMWADHVEISKATVRKAVAAIDNQAAEIRVLQGGKAQAQADLVNACARILALEKSIEELEAWKATA